MQLKCMKGPGTKHNKPQRLLIYIRYSRDVLYRALGQNESPGLLAVVTHLILQYLQTVPLRDWRDSWNRPGSL